MPKISRVTARQIIDSRSVPTIEVSVTLDSGHTAYSSAPSGGVINKAEAVELRDRNPNEYFGLGVSQAVQLVNTEINQRLVGMDPLYQNQIDQALVDLDGTPNKARLGGNSLLATSQAVVKAAALSLNLPLYVYIKEKYQLVNDFRVPTPIFNLINGGRHGSGSLDFQEFQVVPASHLPFRKALQIGIEIFLSLERVLEQKGAIRAVGLEGGFSPNLATNTDALEILFEACQGTAYTLSKDAFLGIDVSPQNFHKGGRFIIRDKNEPLSPKQLIAFLKDLHTSYRVFAFEDALLPDAWADWKLLTSELGATAMILADDLIATNKTLLLKAIEEKTCNSIVIKPNRAGTVTETVEVISLAKQAGWHTVLSHRSGETNDDFIADLAVGVGTEYVKFGATSRGERVEKYNRLLRIQEELEALQQGNTPAITPVSPLTPPAPWEVSGSNPPASEPAAVGVPSVVAAVAEPELSGAAAATAMPATAEASSGVGNSLAPNIAPQPGFTPEPVAPTDLPPATPEFAPVPELTIEGPAEKIEQVEPMLKTETATELNDSTMEAKSPSDNEERAFSVTPAEPALPDPDDDVIVLSTRGRGLYSDYTLAPGVSQPTSQATGTEMNPEQTGAVGGAQGSDQDAQASLDALVQNLPQ